MDKQTVRDVIGEPEGWSNSVSDEPVTLPVVSGAIILNVFSNLNEVSIHWLGETGFETLSVFQIADQTMRESVVTALKPGQSLLEALGALLGTA